MYNITSINLGKGQREKLDQFAKSQNLSRSHAMREILSVFFQYLEDRQTPTKETRGSK